MPWPVDRSVEMGRDPAQVVMLPGAVLPAGLAYGALLAELGADVEPRPKELEVYAGDAPPSDYSLATEVAGITRVADDAGFERVHLVGYSAGGAAALAFCGEPAWASPEPRPVGAGLRGLAADVAG
jgi:pimeloyl-ACP methyl ester carboxylesterase